MKDFHIYHQENPQIWDMFMKYAFEAKYAGRKHIGAKLIMERIRWETMVKGNDGYKVNNNYTAKYARMLMLCEPKFEGFFRLRDKSGKECDIKSTEGYLR